jgi:hypothetical protein
VEAALLGANFLRSNKLPEDLNAGCLVSTVTTVDFQQLAAEQKKCADCKFMSKQSSLQVCQVQLQDVSVWCDFSTGSPRPLVPATCRAAVFDSLQGLAHPGVRVTRRLISSHSVLPKMSSDIHERCRSCI